MKNFSERLKAARKRVGWTQTKLAETLGVSNGALGNWESGKNEQDRDRLKKIADILGTTEEFLNGSVDEIKEDVKINAGALAFNEMTGDELKFLFGSKFTEYSDAATGIQRKRVLLGSIADLARELQKRIPQ